LRSIDVKLNLSPDNPSVMANPIRLEQVFMNLLTNARDAVAESSTRVITISSCVEAGSVRLRFQDTGPGVPPELEQRIFDPFFTTKDVGAGTGLGLSITYGIVKDHEGSIRLENRPGSWLSFHSPGLNRCRRRWYE
jgi:C4-dicarboxylate-specific signal transduction histidine kinase